MSFSVDQDDDDDDDSSNFNTAVYVPLIIVFIIAFVLAHIIPCFLFIWFKRKSRAKKRKQGNYYGVML